MLSSCVRQILVSLSIDTAIIFGRGNPQRYTGLSDFDFSYIFILHSYGPMQYITAAYTGYIDDDAV